MATLTERVELLERLVMNAATRGVPDASPPVDPLPPVLTEEELVQLAPPMPRVIQQP